MTSAGRLTLYRIGGTVGRPASEVCCSKSELGEIDAGCRRMEAVTISIRGNTRLNQSRLCLSGTPQRPGRVMSSNRSDTVSSLDRFRIGHRAAALWLSRDCRPIPIAPSRQENADDSLAHSVA